jgi:hyperosmotically inducible periplasmic protein
MRGDKLWIAAAAASLAFAAGTAFAADTGVKSDQPVSDSYITTKVKAELAKDSSIKARHIHVKTTDGIVMLSGNVASNTEKQKAEQDAGGVKGVVQVKNDLNVKEP